MISEPGFIADWDLLRNRLINLKAEGMIITFGNGRFDIIHAGHIRYLKAAKALGDVLVVGLNSDKSRKCLIPQEERAEILCNIRSVDFVTFFDEDTPIELIKKIRPHFHCKGSDYNLDCLLERQIDEELGISIQFVGGPKIRNSSEIKRSL